MLSLFTYILKKFGESSKQSIDSLKSTYNRHRQILVYSFCAIVVSEIEDEANAVYVRVNMILNKFQ